jgi:hypothetical protein
MGEELSAAKPVDQLVRESLEALARATEHGAVMPPEAVQLLMATLEAVAPLAARKAAQDAGLAKARSSATARRAIPDGVRRHQSARVRARMQELRAKFPKISKAAARRIIAGELKAPVGRVTKYLAAEK